MRTIKTGMVGTGNISDVYLSNSKLYDVLEIAAICDMNAERANEKAEKYGIAKVYTDMNKMMADPEIEAIIDLTNPGAHYSVNMAALRAGKHVYTEKTLAVTYEQGREIIELAAKKGLRVGVAPDTFLSGRLQMCRKLIDDGIIGKPVAATAFFAYHGHETWHPEPFYYYKEGAGPVFDEGPYWITALLALLGPATRVCGLAQKTYNERTVLSSPHAGEKIKVEVPTHVTGSIEFACGAIATVITSFDIWDSHLPRLEIYGTEGSISLPEADPLGGPNMYGGPLLLRKAEDSDWRNYQYTGELHDATPWENVESVYGYNSGNERILGYADMCAAINSGRPHRASGEMGLATLEILEALLTSSESGQYYKVRTVFEKPDRFNEDMKMYCFAE